MFLFWSRHDNFSHMLESHLRIELFLSRSIVKIAIIQNILVLQSFQWSSQDSALQTMRAINRLPCFVFRALLLGINIYLHVCFPGSFRVRQARAAEHHMLDKLVIYSQETISYASTKFCFWQNRPYVRPSLHLVCSEILHFKHPARFRGKSHCQPDFKREKTTTKPSLSLD